MISTFVYRDTPDTILFRKKKGELLVSYLSSDLPEYACPTIRVLSPLGKLSDKVFVARPVIKEGNNFLIRKDGLCKAAIILIQRTAFLDISISELKSPWRKIIYEIDDLLIEVPTSNPYKSFFARSRNKIIDAGFNQCLKGTAFSL